MKINFSKITSNTRPTGSCNFVFFEKFFRAYQHQIAIEIMLFPIITRYLASDRIEHSKRNSISAPAHVFLSVYLLVSTCAMIGEIRGPYFTVQPEKSKRLFGGC